MTVYKEKGANVVAYLSYQPPSSSSSSRKGVSPAEVQANLADMRFPIRLIKLKSWALNGEKFDVAFEVQR